MKKLLLLIIVLMATFTLAGCDLEADVVSENLSTEADQFKILRKVVFYNVITGEYMYAMEGYCSIEADTADEQLEVTCKLGEDSYVKHFLGISDNVSYMVLQIDGANVSTNHYKIYLRPQTLIPSVELDVE